MVEKKYPSHVVILEIKKNGEKALKLYKYNIFKDVNEAIDRKDFRTAIILAHIYVDFYMRRLTYSHFTFQEKNKTHQLRKNIFEKYVKNFEKMFEICKSLGYLKNYESKIKNLNNLRNKVAHFLHYKEKSYVDMEGNSKVIQDTDLKKACENSFDIATHLYNILHKIEEKRFIKTHKDKLLTKEKYLKLMGKFKK